MGDRFQIDPGQVAQVGGQLASAADDVAAVAARLAGTLSEIGAAGPAARRTLGQVSASQTQLRQAARQLSDIQRELDQRLRALAASGNLAQAVRLDGMLSVLDAQVGEAVGSSGELEPGAALGNRRVDPPAESAQPAPDPLGMAARLAPGVLRTQVVEGGPGIVADPLPEPLPAPRDSFPEQGGHTIIEREPDLGDGTIVDPWPEQGGHTLVDPPPQLDLGRPLVAGEPGGQPEDAAPGTPADSAEATPPAPKPVWRLIDPNTGEPVIPWTERELIAHTEEPEKNPDFIAPPRDVDALPPPTDAKSAALYYGGKVIDVLYGIGQALGVLPPRPGI